MTTRNNELRENLDALLEEFVLYRDDTPHSNEPTELSVYLRQCDFPDAMSRLGDELQEFINSEALALLDRLQKEAVENTNGVKVVGIHHIEAERSKYANTN